MPLEKFIVFLQGLKFECLINAIIKSLYHNFESVPHSACLVLIRLKRKL